MSASLTAAVMTSWHAVKVPAGAWRVLSCLYVVVDAGRPDVAESLASAHRCGNLARWDWKAVAATRRALVGVDLLHACGASPALRLVFDTRRHRHALERVAVTGALVVGSQRWGHHANRVAIYRIDSEAVRHAARSAERALRELLAPWN